MWERSLYKIFMDANSFLIFLQLGIRGQEKKNDIYI